MDRNEILRNLCAELKLEEDDVVNAYQFGSYVYGTNDAASDRDYLLIVRSPRPPLVFTDDIKYFHQFDLRRLSDQCDVCVHSMENFEVLLEHHYLLAVECIFYPDEFVLKSTIDYRSIYLNRYYNPLRLRQVSFYEHQFSLKQCDYEYNYGRHPSSLAHKEDSERVTLKILFHGIRYLDIAEQLISSKKIDDFKRVTHLYFELKQTYQNCAPYDLFSLVDSLVEHSNRLMQEIDRSIVQSLDVVTGACCLRSDPTNNVCTHLVHRDCLQRLKQGSSTSTDDFVLISDSDDQ